MKNQLTPEDLSRKTEKELLELQVQIAHATYMNSETIKNNVGFIFRLFAIAVIIVAVFAVASALS